MVTKRRRRALAALDGAWAYDERRPSPLLWLPIDVAATAVLAPFAPLCCIARFARCSKHCLAACREAFKRSALASAHRALRPALGVSRCHDALLSGRCDPLFAVAACLRWLPHGDNNMGVALRWGDSQFGWLVFRAHPDKRAIRASGEPCVKRLLLALDIVPDGASTCWRALRAALVALTLDVLPAPPWDSEVIVMPRLPADGEAVYNHVLAVANTATSGDLPFGYSVVRTRFGALRMHGVVRGRQHRRVILWIWATPYRASSSVWRFARAMVKAARRFDAATPIRLAYVRRHGDDEDQIAPPSWTALNAMSAALCDEGQRLLYAPPRTVTSRQTLSSYAVRLHRCASDLLLRAADQ